MLRHFRGLVDFDWLADPEHGFANPARNPDKANERRRNAPKENSN
jgi:hypothetical protein